MNLFGIIINLLEFYLIVKNKQYPILWIKSLFVILLIMWKVIYLFVSNQNVEAQLELFKILLFLKFKNMNNLYEYFI